MQRNLFIVLGVLLALAAVVHGWGLFRRGERLASPDELAEQALHAESPQKQEIAAFELAQLGKEAKQQLRRVLGESSLPQVRAECIRGLAAQWDFDSMETFLDALDDQSPLVRGRASAAVQRMMSVNVDFPHKAPPEEREPVVKHLRQRWQSMQDSGILESWKKRLEDKGEL